MIELKNISKIFGKFKAVDNLNLKINTGECFGLLGKNGAGKTTTIKMIVGLLKPSLGDIYFDGVTMEDKFIEIKQKLAYIPDTPYVYEKLTGMEFLFFIGYTYKVDKQTIQERAKKFIKLFNIEDVINKKTEDYSHGMIQKLIFTASLIHNPEYLIIDEPMVGLDPQSNKIVKDIIKELTTNYNVTIILTTHQLNVAQDVCDRIGIIHNGKLKKLLNSKEEFGENLENEFINITGGYNKDDIKNLFGEY